MQRKTKEEILSENVNSMPHTMHRPSVRIAMQEYADQEMFNLLLWIITRNIKISCNEFRINGRGISFPEIIDQYKKEV
jgi:hypothetical protein